MRIVRRALAAAFALAALAALAAGPAAAATQVQFSPGGSVSLAGRVTFTQNESIGMPCTVRLQGSLTRAAVMLPGLIGEITSGSMEACFESTGAFLFGTGRWPLAASSISGTLPSEVTGVNVTLQGFAHTITLGMGAVRLTCLYVGNEAASIALSGTGSPFASGTVTLLPTFALELTRGSNPLCRTRETVEGSLTLTAQAVSVS